MGASCAGHPAGPAANAAPAEADQPCDAQRDAETCFRQPLPAPALNLVTFIFAALT